MRHFDSESIRPATGVTDAAVALLIIGVVIGAIARSSVVARRKADSREAQIDVQSLTNAVRLYERKHAALPDSLEQLGFSLQRDPWGNPYLYRRTAKAFEISSYGPDQAPGGGDDVTVEPLDKS